MMKHETRGGGVLPRRRAICCALAAGLARVWAGEFTVIYADESWYRERKEPEREWRGVLRERQPERGPGSRVALRLQLQTSDGSVPVYAADRKLSGYRGKRVIARAKLVDLRAEGFGEELWIGAVRAAD